MPPPGACGTVPPQEIPAASPLGLAALALALVVAGLSAHRRRWATGGKRPATASSSTILAGARVLVLLAALATTAAAEPAVWTAAGVPTGLREVSRLVRIDPVTGQIAELLPLEPGFLYLPNELDFAPDGDLWGVGTLAIPIDPVPPASFRIDPQGDVSGGPLMLFSPSFAISAPPGICGNGPPLVIPVASPGGLVALALLLAISGAALARGSRAERRQSPGR
jgi:hypothetical protein